MSVSAGLQYRFDESDMHRLCPGLITVVSKVVDSRDVTALRKLGHHLHFQMVRSTSAGIGYTLIYLLKGSLPWQNLRGQSKQEKYQAIADVKMSTPLDVLCRGLPTEFISYMNYVKNLEFTDVPNYKYLSKLFRNLAEQNKFDINYQYDWSQRLNQQARKVKIHMGDSEANINYAQKDYRQIDKGANEAVVEQRGGCGCWE